VLFVHGWDSDRDQYLARAREVAALGCVCLTFDLRGHAATGDQRDTITREDNLRDVVAAYDVLARHPAVDPSAIAVVGSSYGGYLAAALTGVRPVRCLALRVPALYKDEDWALPKSELRDNGLDAFRQRPVGPEENRALGACAAFEGDVLLVRSERDDTVPPPVTTNYMAAFRKVRSLTYRVIAGADHGLSEERWQQAYTSLLLTWATEMVLGAREGGALPEVQTAMRPSPRREPARPA
jgi:pimeloyl-ACP methyl ester carboxylesterase